MPPSVSSSLWNTLSSNPLLWITVTLIAYQCGLYLFAKTRQKAWANPVLIAIVLIGIFLEITQTSYEQYFRGANVIHFLLGPATVALAVPLHSSWHRLRKMLGPLCIALCAGSATAAFSAMGIAKLLGASSETVFSLGPKSVTTPIAMGVAEAIGGLPSLTAVLVILTGILGAIGFPTLFKLLRIKNHVMQGFAVGLTSHGLGTARAFMFSEEMGAFSALAMGLNGILTAVVLPLLFHR